MAVTIQFSRDCGASLKRQLQEDVWTLLSSLNRNCPEPPNANLCPPGGVVFAADNLQYSIDRQRARLDPSDGCILDEDCAIPEFERVTVEHFGEDVNRAGPSSTGCFNCGQQGHGVKDCSEPFDADRVREARKAFGMDRQEVHAGGDGSSASAERLAASFPDVRPGQISKRLQDALGMDTGRPAPFLRSMRRHGYPPAYSLPIAGVDDDRHWGYASNGSLSQLLASIDSGYAAVFPHTRAGCARGARLAAARVALSSVAVFEHAEEEGVGTAVGVAPPVVTHGGLFDAPLSHDLRLTPFLPVCVCGRKLTVDFPGLSVRHDPAVHSVAQPTPGADGSQGADGDGGMEIDEDNDSAADVAAPPAKRARTTPAPAGVAFTWPLPITEAAYCPVHKASVVKGSHGGDFGGATHAVEAPVSTAAADHPSSEPGDGGAPDTDSHPRLSRFLSPRDREALAATLAAGAGSWYSHIGGTSEVGAPNPVISESVKAAGRRRSGTDVDSDDDDNVASE